MSTIWSLVGEITAVSKLPSPAMVSRVVLSVSGDVPHASVPIGQTSSMSLVDSSRPPSAPRVST
jgi:hypothetical protein